MKFSRQLLAARLGMTPESLLCAFAQLTALGVQSRGKQVHIAEIGRQRIHCLFEDIV